MISKSFKYKIVGIYSDRSTVDYLINELNDIGYSKNDISVLTKEFELAVSHSSITHNTNLITNTDCEFSNYHDINKKESTNNSIIGSFSGLTPIMIPGLGPIIATGPITRSIANIVGGANTSIGDTAGTIIGILKEEGIPNHRAAFYNRHFNKGDVIVMLHTENQGLPLSRKIMGKFKPRNIDIF